MHIIRLFKLLLFFFLLMVGDTWAGSGLAETRVRGTAQRGSWSTWP